MFPTHKGNWWLIAAVEVVILVGALPALRGVDFSRSGRLAVPKSRAYLGKMRLSRFAAATLCMAAIASGCGGGVFEAADDDDGTAGKTSSAGKPVGSGGSSTSEGGAGSDEPIGTGADTSEGGAFVTERGGSGGTQAGTPATGGNPPVAGASGSSMAGSGGAGSGTGGNTSMVDGPLEITDLEGINADKLTGVHVTGFRCKSLTVCGVNQNCVYYTGFLGSMQSQDEPYSDGDELDQPQAVRIKIATGAGAQNCMSTLFTTVPGQFVKLTHDGGHIVSVYFPEFSGETLTLYVHANGNTYFDAALTQLAGKP